MKVRVMLFAIQREKLGRSEVQLDLPSRAKVSDLLEEMARRFPEFVNLNNGLMIAVNTEYVDINSSLDEGDEVALIPPVSGGKG